MNFQGKAVLVYLEEDNIARAYFRIQPLMTQEGAVTADMKAAYPDEGYLRIVPDKNEQHTFKERMRTMCGLCMMDLRFQPAEANKIRTNKNYSPSRGENNQYIVYSDAVRTIPDDLFYQVVAEADKKNAVTPYVYIRNGANIQGPFPRDEGKEAGETAQLPPDSTEIHAVTLRDGQELLFYWPAPKQEEAPVPQQEEAPAPIAEPAKEEPAPEAALVPETTVLEQIQEMNTGLSENANRLNAPSAAPADFFPEQPQKPLTGTRLYQAPQRAAAPRRAHNPLMEAVDQQRYAAKYEAPGAVLPQSAQLKDVENPINALKRALHAVWQSADAQQQAIEVLRSQSGMAAMLSKALATENNDITLTAMKSQLQEMEAERLMMLMQMDDVKKNMAAAREEAVDQLTKDEQRRLDEITALQKKAQEELDALQAAMPALEEKRQEAVQAIAAAKANEGTAALCPAAGIDCARAELISRVEKAMQSAGFVMEKGDALALLTSYAVSHQNWQLCADNLADAHTAAAAFAAALGAPLAYDNWNKPTIIPGGNGPAFLMYGNAPASSSLVTPLSVVCKEENCYGDNTFDFEIFPYACAAVSQAQAALPQPLSHFAPVSKACILREMVKDAALNNETVAAVAAIRKAVAAAGKPLALSTVRMLCSFIASTQNDLPGGVAEALDRAVCLFVVPHLKVYKITLDEIKPLFAAMPRTLKVLN